MSGPACSEAMPSGMGNANWPIIDAHDRPETALMTVKSRPDDLCAYVLSPPFAPLALHTGPTDWTYTDTLTNCEPVHVGADCRDCADDLMARQERVMGHAPVVVHHRHVGMADSAMSDAYIDFIGAEFSKIELKWFQILFRRFCRIGMHLHRFSPEQS
jgi:hypothetical protein